MSLSESKQLLSDLTSRKAKAEAKIESIEQALESKVNGLREIYGERIPDDPTEIPFEELAKEIEDEWNSLEQEIDSILNEVTDVLEAVEKEYDVANGSTTTNG